MSTIPDPLLIRKYNQPVPRYTSYPTVPNWHDKMDIPAWEDAFSSAFSEQNITSGISLYIHLPFCESLCTYCGCNKKITSNHSVENVYMTAIKKEWDLYCSLMDAVPVIREIHLGGGTPTFFSPANLKELLSGILHKSIIHPKHAFSIEGHPNNTTADHLQVLYDLGFRRVSFGVQDNDPDVQQIINRLQPFENVKGATENARSAGFTSVNFDLIYGLPLQTLESIRRTFDKVLQLRPDRIAFYSYAHVPWTSKAQRLFDESHLPSPGKKLDLYMKGRKMLLNAGYTHIGMDHFALPSDELYQALQSGRLYRNFMGYTTQNSGLLLGLGVSAISDTGNAYAQNSKTLHDYYAKVNEGRLPVEKGYILSECDKQFRKYILDISCTGFTSFDPAHLEILEQYTFEKLAGFETDGLVTWNAEGLTVTTTGRYFLRNICAAFDLYLQQQQSRNIYSRAI